MVITGKSVIITGVLGFIGSHLAAEALSQGYKVSGMDIKEPRTKHTYRCNCISGLI